MRAAERARVGPGAVLLSLYALFVVAAGARSIAQLSLHASRAPVAYTLSAVAAAVYATGFVLVRQADRGRATRAARAAAACAIVELIGVLAVGTASVIDRSAFPDASVWSHFGAGYLLVPLVLPVAVLGWLRRR